MRTLFAAGIVTLAALALAGCADGSAAGSGSTSTPKVPFVAMQPEDARLLVAAQEVKSRIGHEVTVDVDAELLKEHAPHLQAALSDTLETIARGIDRARAESPAAAIRACAGLAKLKIELDDHLREPIAFIDPDTATLVLRVPNGATYFATDAGVASAFAAE